MKLNVKALVFGILTIAVLVLIYLFSAQNGETSGEQSGFVTKIICRILFLRFDEFSLQEQMFLIDELHHFVRKLAHFSIYTCLGMSTFAFVLSLVSLEKIKKMRFVIAFAFCFLSACADEIHQAFVPERAGQFTDVLIDSAGALLGIVISLIIAVLIKNIKMTIKSRKIISSEEV